MARKKAKGSRKNRKIGRNEFKCQIYKNKHQRERNKIRKILRHLKRHFKDLQSQRRVVELKLEIK